MVHPGDRPSMTGVRDGALARLILITSGGPRKYLRGMQMMGASQPQSHLNVRCMRIVDLAFLASDDSLASFEQPHLEVIQTKPGML